MDLMEMLHEDRWGGEAMGRWTPRDLIEQVAPVRLALQDNGHAVFVAEPGNGTRYEFVFQWIPEGLGLASGAGLLVSLPQWRKCHVFARVGWLSLDYVCEKFGWAPGPDAAFVANVIMAVRG